MDDVNAPIDDLHAMCLIERDGIRMIVAVLLEQVRRWEPRPYRQEEGWDSSPSMMTSSASPSHH